MIIVSQDKKVIENLNNLVSVYVIENYDDKTKYNIDFATIDESNFILGTYETEERAEEVLKEIYKNYSDFELIKCTNDVNTQHNLIMRNRDKYFDVYEMPEN